MWILEMLSYNMGIFKILQLLLILIYVVLLFVKSNKAINITIIVLIVVQLICTISVFKLYDYSREMNKYKGRCSSAMSCDCPADSEMCDCIICDDPDATGDNNIKCDIVHIQCRNNQRNEGN